MRLMTNATIAGAVLAAAAVGAASPALAAPQTAPKVAAHVANDGSGGLGTAFVDPVVTATKFGIPINIAEQAFGGRFGNR